MVAGGFFHVYPHQREQQRAYDFSLLVLGLEELHLLTGDTRTRDLALECAEWLDGNNPAGARVYDPHTGCCACGITEGRVSAHCGAESAIEAGFIHLARVRLHAKPSSFRIGPPTTPAIISPQ